MKDEIKEILDGFKEILDNPTTSDECYDGRVIVIDRSYDLDLDEIKLLLDYITNLQEENKNLKQINEEHRKLNGELRNGYCEIKEKCNKGECDCTNEEYESMTQANMKLRLLLEDYKARIDKAIEYIKEKSEEVELNFYGFPDKITSFRGSVSILLNILQGKSDE